MVLGMMNGIGKQAIGMLLGLLFIGGASANVNLDVHATFTTSMPNNSPAVLDNVPKVTLCAQPQTQSLSCSYGQLFEILSQASNLIPARGYENYHFLDLPSTKDVLHLIIEVTSEKASGQSTSRIIIPFPKTLSVSDDPSTVDVYNSDTLSLSLEYKLSSNCGAGMYGERCERECVPPRQQAMSGCKYTCNYLGEVVCVNDHTQVQIQKEGVFQREKRQTGNNSGLDANTVIIISVVTVLGTWLIMVVTLILLFVLCFVKCDKNCKPKLSRKPCSSNAAQRCCESCADSCCKDDNDFAFWATLILLGIVCLPFAVCVLVLYGFALGGGK